METFLLKLCNMSISASYLIVAVIMVRILLKKVPRKMIVLLWGLVALRLMIPFSYESMISLIPQSTLITMDSLKQEQPQINQSTAEENSLENPTIKHPNNHSSSVLPTKNSAIDNSSDEKAHQTITDNHVLSSINILFILWIIGMISLVAYGAFTIIKLNYLLSTAIPMCDNIYFCDRISTSFIFGVLRPRIYLPYIKEDGDLYFIMEHEKAHIQRKDHIIKVLGYVLLIIYWFNPLVWLGYTLFCRDIELACDEKVIKNMGVLDRKSYSSTLLTYSVNRYSGLIYPLAFGEVGVKQRVKNILHYKKPTLWVVLVAVIIIITMGLCFLSDPIPKQKEIKGNSQGDHSKISITPSPEPTKKVIKEPTNIPVKMSAEEQFLEENYPYLEDDFKTLNSEAGQNGLIRSYKMEDNKLYYIFKKDNVTLTFPDQEGGEYTLEVGSKKGTYHWPITYYPGSKQWFKAELIDVTKDGIKDLCVSLYLGSGTGVNVSGLYIVNLRNMKEVRLLDVDNNLRMVDAKKLNQFLIQQKKKYDYLDWVTSTPKTNWNIMDFSITSKGDISIGLGIFKDDGMGDYMGILSGSYEYQNGEFALKNIKYEPELIDIYDGYEPEMKDVVEYYGNENITSQEYTLIGIQEIKRILKTSQLGEGNIIIYEGNDFKIYAGYQMNNKIYRMDLLEDPNQYNQKIIRDGFIDEFVFPDSITKYSDILGTTGAILKVGHDDWENSYYYYDINNHRPVKLVKVTSSWDAIDLDENGTKELVSKDYDGVYSYAFIIHTVNGLKAVEIDKYGLHYDADQKCFVRDEDKKRFKFDGKRFLLIGKKG